jgi:hypothetical protein
MEERRSHEPHLSNQNIHNRMNDPLGVHIGAGEGESEFWRIQEQIFEAVRFYIFV